MKRLVLHNGHYIHQEQEDFKDLQCTVCLNKDEKLLVNRYGVCLCEVHKNDKVEVMPFRKEGKNKLTGKDFTIDEADVF